MPTGKRAVIDVGTNSVRLLVARQVSPGLLEPCLHRVTITRLGEGMGGRPTDNCLKRAPVERTLQAIKECIKEVIREKAELAGIIATSAVREAGNRDYFIKRIKAETNLNLKIISGEREAELSYLGVLKSLSLKDKRSILVFDLGGGSLEFAWQKKNQVLGESLKMGAVRLNSQYITSDPPGEQEIKSLRSYIMDTLGLFRERNPGLPEKLVGVGGTVTTLSAVQQGLQAYDPGKVHGSVLTREGAQECLQKFLVVTGNKRRSLPGMQAGREDIIIAGTVVIISIMETFCSRELTISEGDLLLGVLYSFSGPGRGSG